MSKHVFRRGIDWGNDPTGQTILPSTVLVDGLSGNDANDGLSLETPMKTPTAAKAAYPGFQVVCAPFRYVDELGNTGSGETTVYIGDSTDDDVVFISSQGNLNGFAVSGFENITLINYLNANPGNQRIAVNCTFVVCSELVCCAFLIFSTAPLL